MAATTRSSHATTNRETRGEPKCVAVVVGDDKPPASLNTHEDHSAPHHTDIRNGW